MNRMELFYPLFRIGYGIAVDSSGNAYVTGSTTSTQATFPVTVGPDLTLNGGVNAFVAKIGASGAPEGGDATAALLPSSARAAGAGGAFFTTDLTVSNTGASNTTFTLKFLGHDQNGTGGSEQTFALAAGKTVTYTDVPGSVFSLSSGFGGIRIVSPSAALNILGQTSTPGFGGTFGQSVPASAPEDLILSGTPRSLVAVREDAAFLHGSFRRRLRRAARAFDGDEWWTFAAYASAIDTSTNDPRTLLPT